MVRKPDPVVWAVAGLAGLAGALGVIGTDALWLVPLGHEIAHGHLPSSIPFAKAPTSGWHNAPAAAELLFWGLYHLLGGARGLVAAQAAAAAVGFGALAWGVRREGTSGTTLAVCSVTLVGVLPAVVVTGVSLFSLALFPVLLALLEAETRAPSRRVWLAVPLLLVWGNLHGAVLAGFGLLACYLVFERARQSWKLSLEVLAAGALALFVTPALWNTPAYYWGVLRSEPARSGEGLWRPLGLGGFDIVLVVAAVVLAVCALHRGRWLIRLWEGVALGGLILGTIDVARNGTWLLFVLAYPAARGLDLDGLPRRLLVGTGAVSGIVALSLLVRGPADPGSVALARLAAHDRQPVLAPAVLGQQVALLDGKVWVGNPIDAFRRADQRLYLDWAAGRPERGGRRLACSVRAREDRFRGGGGRGFRSPARARRERPERRPLQAQTRELRRAPGVGALLGGRVRWNPWSVVRPVTAVVARSMLGGPGRLRASRITGVRVRRVGGAARSTGDYRSVRSIARTDRRLRAGGAEAAGRGEGGAEVAEEVHAAAEVSEEEALDVAVRVDGAQRCVEMAGYGRSGRACDLQVAGERARHRRRVVDAPDVDRDRARQPRVGARSGTGERRVGDRDRVVVRRGASLRVAGYERVRVEAGRDEARAAGWAARAGDCDPGDGKRRGRRGDEQQASARNAQVERFHRILLR